MSLFLKSSAFGVLPCRLPWIARMRLASRFHIRPPSKAAPRESPTPLVFVSSSEWQPESSLGLVSLSSRLSEKGFTCLEIDLPFTQKSESSELMQYYENELRQHIRLSTLIFPPVIFSRSLGSLIAQTYISSNPAAGLVLINPPASNKPASEDGSLPSPLTEFDYEPHFPVAVVNTQAETTKFQGQSRFGDSPDIDWLVVESLEKAGMVAQVEQWLDEIGV